MGERTTETFLNLSEIQANNNKIIHMRHENENNLMSETK